MALVRCLAGFLLDAIEFGRRFVGGGERRADVACGIGRALRSRGGVLGGVGGRVVVSSVDRRRVPMR